MAKIKLSKNELKKQKDALKRFQRYLPTLILKKQQLQLVIRQLDHKIAEIKERQDQLAKSVSTWIQVFGEENEINTLLTLNSVKVDEGNIAGVDIPIFREAIFSIKPYNLIQQPLWIDSGLILLKEMLTLDAEIEVLKQQQHALADELKTTSQRVNLFEKIKIPESKQLIKKIQIYLGDGQTAAVVRGKIAKSNLVKVS